jgi:hypothetical protein
MRITGLPKPQDRDTFLGAPAPTVMAGTLRVMAGLGPAIHDFTCDPPRLAVDHEGARFDV